MKTRLILITIFVSLVCILNTQAQQNITIPDSTIFITDTLVIPVNTSNINTSENIISYQFNLNYDVTKFHYESFLLTNTIAQNGTISINNTSGIINISYMNSTPLNGSGAIIKLKFVPLQTGISDLSITDFIYNTDTITNVNNGTITVTQNCLSQIHGTASYSGGFIGSGDAKVMLYRAGINGHHQLIDSTFIGSNGSFNLQNIQPENYYLYVKLNNNNAPYQHVHNTYLDTTFKWQNATVMNLNCGTDTNVTIHMFETTPVNQGNGHMKGKVQLYSIYSGGKTMGEPVPGAEIYVELEPDDEPIANSTTDTAGFYEITGLPDGTYGMYVDIPGFPLVQTYSGVTVNGTDTLFTNLNFYVDTTILSSGIYTSDVVSINKIETPEFSVKLFPNPVEKYLSIESINQNEKLTIELLDMNAKSLYKLTIDNNTKVDMTKFLQGIYLVKLQSKNTVIIKRIIKQ